jgi:hypothetical protein
VAPGVVTPAVTAGWRNRGLGVRGQRVRCRVDRGRGRRRRGLPDRVRSGPGPGRQRLDARAGLFPGLPAGPGGNDGARGELRGNRGHEMSEENPPA